MIPGYGQFDSIKYTQHPIPLLQESNCLRNEAAQNTRKTLGNMLRSLVVYKSLAVHNLQYHTAERHRYAGLRVPPALVLKPT
jgi:hypothetical protein